MNFWYSEKRKFIMELKNLDREDITITFKSIFGWASENYYERHPTTKERRKFPLQWDKEAGGLYTDPKLLEPKIKPLSANQKKKRLEEEKERLKTIFGKERWSVGSYQEECKAMVNDYPDDFYMYEEYLVFIHYLFLFEDVYSYLDQFDEELKAKILDSYRKHIPRGDLLSFME